jgi:diguanylate cyclase (GGDEF)-like protein/PAS domain S-box-containing protein
MALPMIGSALITCVAALLTWRRLRVPGAWSLLWLFLASTLWAGCYGVMLMTASMAGQIFWLKVVFLGALAVPTLAVMVVMHFVGQGHRADRRALSLLSLWPLVSVLILLTDPMHHLFFSSFGWVKGDSYDFLTFHKGPWFWATFVYSLALFVAMAFMLINAILEAPRIFRNRNILVTAALSMPWVLNLFVVLRISGPEPLDLTPLGIGLSGLIYTVSLLRYSLLDLNTVARRELTEHMKDALLVLDWQGNIADLNWAALELSGLPAGEVVGHPLGEIFAFLVPGGPAPGSWGLGDESGDAQERVLELAALRAGQECWFEVRRFPLLDGRKVPLGAGIIVRNITERRQAQEAARQYALQLEHLQAQLQEQAIRDPITGAFNRRYLVETLDRELANATRHAYGLALLMIDIDHFKQVNDAHGHLAGDQVLRKLTALLQKGTRAGDAVCRFGGEEFVILMPQISLANSLKRAEVLRATVQGSPEAFAGHQISFTVSLGVAHTEVQETTSELLLEAADRALFQAKAAGRNRVVGPGA